MQSKICEGIPCSSFYVKEFGVVVHKKYFACIILLIFLAILYNKSLANLVVEGEISIITRSYWNSPDLSTVEVLIPSIHEPGVSLLKLRFYYFFPLWTILCMY